MRQNDNIHLYSSGIAVVLIRRSCFGSSALGISPPCCGCKDHSRLKALSFCHFGALVSVFETSLTCYNAKDYGRFKALSFCYFGALVSALGTSSSCYDAKDCGRFKALYSHFAMSGLSFWHSGPALLVAVAKIIAVLKHSRFAISALLFRRSGPALLVAVVKIMDAALELRSGS